MPRNVIMLGSQRGLKHRCDRFFLEVDSFNFSFRVKDSDPLCKIAIFVSFRFIFIRWFFPDSMHQNNPTHLHSQTPTKKKCCHTLSSGSPTWIKHESYVCISNPSKEHPSTVGLGPRWKAYGSNAYGFEFAGSLWRIGSPVTRWMML